MRAIGQVIALAAAQQGTVSAGQAQRLGLSRSTFHDLVHREGWRRLHRGVYALPGSPANHLQAARAALLATDPVGVLCRRTAAHLLRLLPPPQVVEIFVPQDTVISPLRGVRLYRTRTLQQRDVTLVDDLRTTVGPRTAIDLAAVLEPPELRAILIDGRQRRAWTFERIERRLATVGPVRGSGVLRRMLWELRPEHCDSILESRVRTLLRNADVERPHPAPWPVSVGGRTVHVDIAWPQRRVGIEADGFAFHSDRAAMDVDHRRANLLTTAGWRVLRVGWGRLDRDPEGFVAEVRTLMK